MRQLLRQEEGREFWVSDRFEGRMLRPIAENLLDKAEKNWDDYDEVYHCCQLVEKAARDKSLSMEFYTLEQAGRVDGIGLMTRGAVDRPLFFPPHLPPQEDQEQVLVFNYFHISPRARGVGERWLREIILPRCREQGFQAVYVKSSHPRVFSLYGRLGCTVGDYAARSDNGLHTRPGRLFRLPLV